MSLPLLIIGTHIPVVLTIMAFVAGGFLHGPINMAYLSLIQPLGIGPGWREGLAWAVVPAAIGNVLGAFSRSRFHSGPSPSESTA